MKIKLVLLSILLSCLTQNCFAQAQVGHRKKASIVAASGLAGVAIGFLLMNLQPKPQENSGLIWAGGLIGTLSGVVYVSMPESQQARFHRAPSLVLPLAQVEF